MCGDNTTTQSRLAFKFHFIFIMGVVGLLLLCGDPIKETDSDENKAKE
jgi:hypothetical protein